VDEQIIQSILKESKLDPRLEFKKIIKLFRIPAMERNNVVEQLVGSWEKSGHDINKFWDLIDSATVTKNFAMQFLREKEFSDLLNRLKGE